MTDHDQLFKELIATFFVEFLELFLPQVASTIEPDSLRFLQQEYFADLTIGEEKVIDLLAEVRQAREATTFLIHVEAQATTEADFSRRMFFYFARLHQKYLQRVYPIVVFSFDQPYRTEPNVYAVEFPDRKILEFNFASIQLNSLNWRDFLQQHNPMAAALMSKMKIAVEDRPKVKVECLRLLATLQLDPARTRLISGFVDTYLRLNLQEEQVFQTEIGKLEIAKQGTVMKIVTSWMEQGRQEGRQETQVAIAQQLLVENLPVATIARVTNLSIEQIQQLAVIVPQSPQA